MAASYGYTKRQKERQRQEKMREKELKRKMRRAQRAAGLTAGSEDTEAASEQPDAQTPLEEEAHASQPRSSDSEHTKETASGNDSSDPAKAGRQ